MHPGKYFSSAPPGDQEALLGHLFNLYPYFADRTIHDAVMRCDSDWWAVRCISLKKRDHIHLAFDTVHCYVSSSIVGRGLVVQLSDNRLSVPGIGVRPYALVGGGVYFANAKRPGGQYQIWIP